MKFELRRWNSGRGISVEDWITCVGNVDLAVGYSTVFWPEFELVGKYILIAGRAPETVKAFEDYPNSTPQDVEAVMNHLHLVDIHISNEVEPSVGHLIRLGTVLKEIYQAKLAWQFPARPCEVEFFIPDDPADLTEYQLTFWQKKWDEATTE